MPDLFDRLKTALADRYRVDREIGRGGMAHVFLAHDLKLDRPVALKVLRPDLAAVLGGDRFLREITLAAKLEHPHILGIHDSGEADGLLYYVMPYVAGESLRGRLARERQLPLDDALQIAREVADALSYAHAHGVVHRDIKPENILLVAGHAVVADFGIARAVNAAGGDRLTETGVTLGTPQYMSPEQVGGSQDLDGRSDLYSLGCMLYEMLAGQPPFTGPTVESVIHQHLAAEPPSITTIRPAVPAQVAATLQRSLAKTPADRFNPVALFAEALGAQATAAVMPQPAIPVPFRPSSPPWRRWVLPGVAAMAVIAAAVAAGRWLRPGATTPTHPRTAIAVLPFQNLSAEGPHSYFAGGLHDELLTQLAKVATLRVIGRTSVLTYEGSTKRLSEIGGELAVGSLVEGSVQVVGDRLRVNVQLIDPVTEAHLWAEHYDRTLDDAFAIQSEIAQRIVEAVGATLGGTERTTIAAAPTGNAEAYRLYLQGLEYSRRPGRLRRNWEIAQGFYERAVTLDSTFALAYAALSVVHGWMSWWRYDPSSARLARQREAAETALRLAPRLPQAHLAMGEVHYRARGNWRAALDEYRLALEGLPNDPDLWEAIGGAHRRLGNWGEVLEAFDRAAQLDPLNADLFFDIGANTLMTMRRYADAAAALDQAVHLVPDFHAAVVRRGLVHVLWRGHLDTLRSALGKVPMGADLGPLGTRDAQHVRLLLWERQSDSVLHVLRARSAGVFEGVSFFTPSSLYAAWAHFLRGDAATARTAFDSALVLLDSVVRVLPDDRRVHATRGLALAGRGRRDDARLEARWLQQSAAYREDAFDAPFVAEDRARILAQTGDADAALDEIEQALAGPSQVSIHTLRLDPLWDPIRNHSRFQALLVKYADPKPVR